MKAIFVTLLALAATTIANPVEVRQLDTQAASITSLTKTVIGHTANINKTAAAVPDSPSSDQANAAALAMAPDLQGITDALTAATATAAKRGLAKLLRRCDESCLEVEIFALVYEIACTLKFIIVKLGLACLLAYLTPLILALSKLVIALDVVVDGLIYVVKGILDSVLGGVAAGLLGLIIW